MADQAPKYCTSCGKELRNNASFCIHCGSSVKGKAASAADPADVDKPADNTEHAEENATAERVKSPTADQSNPATGEQPRQQPVEPKATNAPKSEDSHAQASVPNASANQFTLKDADAWLGQKQEPTAQFANTAQAKPMGNPVPTKPSKGATNAPSYQQTNQYQPLPDLGVQYAPMKPVPTSNNTPKQRSRKKTIITIAIVVAIIATACAIGGVAWYMHNQEVTRIHDEELQTLAHKEYPVSIAVNADGLGTTGSSPVPILIEGTDFEGNEVTQKILYELGGAGPMLPRGSYTLTVASSPINGKGGIYDVAGASTKVVVADSEVDKAAEDENCPELTGSAPATEGADANAHAIAAVPFTLSPVNPVSVTDEMINAAVNGLVDFGYSQSSANTLKELVIKSRDEAVAAAEAARKAEERAAQKKSFQAEFDKLQQSSDRNVSVADHNSNNVYPHYEKYEAQVEDLMNRIYQYELATLPEAQANELRAGQETWWTNFNIDYPSGKDIVSNSAGSAREKEMDSYDRWTNMEKRIQELINIL